MNNYEDRTMSHKRVRMDGEGGAGVVQGNGLPLNYMDHLHKVVGHFPADNGHQVGYGAPPTAYGGGGGYYGGGGGAGGEWGEYGGRGLAYAPPAHQPYQQPPPAAAAAAAFLQHQQHLQMQYEQQRHHLQQQAQHHSQSHHKWPQGIMQPLQATSEQKMKSEVKTEPTVGTEPLNIPQPLSLTTMSATPASAILQSDNSMLGGQVAEDPPKIKIKTDIFKEESSNPAPPTSTPTPPIPSTLQGGTAIVRPAPEEVREKVSETVEKVQPVVTKVEKNAEVEKVTPASEPAPADTSRTNTETTNTNTVIDPTSGESVPVDPSASKPDAVAETPTVAMPSPSSSSSEEDDSKIPNDVYFGTPDIYRNSGSSVASSTGGASATTPTVITPGMEGKKRGRPKGSTNKPKPPEVLSTQSKTSVVGIGRGQVGRPRGGGTPYLGMRPFKRDFSGIRFRRRWSDDCLESSHIPNEVYFGDVPVSMEILFNYYDANADKEKMQQQQQSRPPTTPGTPGSTPSAPPTQGSVTVVFSSSDSSSDDSSDSDSSSDDEDNNDPNRQTPRGRGRPRGSKTVNRRSDGPRAPGSVNSDKAPGVTDMKRYLKAAGVQYDYNKLVEGCTSNKERVAKLLALLTEKGLEGEPTLEKCRALYTGPPRSRRGPPPGVKRGPRKSKSTPPESEDSDEDKPAKPTKPAKEPKKPVAKKAKPENPEAEGARRLTRGQTSGKPRQKIIISSDEEDSPLSKLRLFKKK